MRWLIVGIGVCVPLLAWSADPAPVAPPEPSGPIKWQKFTLDKKFRAEGVAIADVNHDGKPDILVGQLWYEAPDWKPHEISKPGEYGDGLKGYSNIFACWTDDFNGDGWADVLVIDFPGTPCYWLENPKNQPGHWKKHLVWHNACNETPQYVDLLGTGKRALVMGWQPKGKENEGQMAYFTPAADPTALWEMHPISEPSSPAREENGKKIPRKEIPGTFKYAHGLGVGDLNGDGKLDVIVPAGWWEQPKSASKEPWTFHPAALGEACADMFAYDVDNDGKMDVISSSAHKFGIWWFQRQGESFRKHELFKDLVSETHALHCVDVDGDGQKDLITGKRWWSHGRSEPGANMPAVLYWFHAQKGSDGLVKFVPYVIDGDSGVGTQFALGDLNGDGKLDIAISNKKGVCVLVQVAKP